MSPASVAAVKVASGESSSSLQAVTVSARSATAVAAARRWVTVMVGRVLSSLSGVAEQMKVDKG